MTIIGRISNLATSTCLLIMFKKKSSNLKINSSHDKLNIENSSAQNLEIKNRERQKS